MAIPFVARCGWGSHEIFSPYMKAPCPIREEAGLFCGSFLRKGEGFAYVSSIQNVKDLKDRTLAMIPLIRRQAPHHSDIAAVEREGDTLNGFKDFHLENGSKQGQNLALTGFCVPCSLEIGNSKVLLIRSIP